MKPLAYLSVIIAALLAAACTDEMPQPPATQPGATGYPDYAHFVVMQGAEPQGRTSYQDVYVSKFENGDTIGVFALNADMTALQGARQNAIYTVASGANVSTGTDFLYLKPDAGDVDLTAPKYVFYAPYDPSLTTVDQLKNYDFTVLRDQSGKPGGHSTGFQHSDLIWEVGDRASSQNGVIELWFDHAFASIVVELADGFDVDQPVEFSGMSTQAFGMDLTNDLSDLAANPFDYGMGDIKDPGNLPVRMWHSYVNENERHVLRCVVPAGTSRQGVPGGRPTYPAGTEIIKAHIKATNRDKVFSLRQELTLEPGKVYRFVARVANPNINPQEPWDEDRSWVLDVKDPVTGENVGLLCREYIYYCPDDAEYMADLGSYADSCKPYTSEALYCVNPDPSRFAGGVSGTNQAGPVFAVNCQGWVFYNLDGQGLPELKHGQVLRMVYDICPGGGKPGYWEYRLPENRALSANNMIITRWPYPHIDDPSSFAVRQGIFAAQHGHEWGPRENSTYGGSLPGEMQYFMHGAELEWWGPSNPKVKSFTMPQRHVTNAEALHYGHIAFPIDQATQSWDKNSATRPHVSYSPVDDALVDAEGYRAGVIVDHVLVDQVAGESYPLVKIGYNNFWMQRAFRRTTNAQGVPLEVFNHDASADGLFCETTFENASTAATNSRPWKQYLPDVEIGPGLLYPAFEPTDADKAKFETGFAPSTTLWDPYNQMTTGQIRALKIPVMYNNRAVFSPGFVPSSPFSGETYRLPLVEDIAGLRAYVGNLFAAKLISDKMRTVRLTGSSQIFIEAMNEALNQGKFFTYREGPASYCTNISGLMLRPCGVYSSLEGNTKISEGMNSNMSMWVDNKNLPNRTGLDDSHNNDPYDKISIMRFDTWDVWGGHNFGGYFEGLSGALFDSGPWQAINRLCRIFAPVRFVMSFRESNAAPAPRRDYVTRSTSTQYGGTVYVPVE